MYSANFFGFIARVELFGEGVVKLFLRIIDAAAIQIMIGGVFADRLLLPESFVEKIFEFRQNTVERFFKKQNVGTHLFEIVHAEQTDQPLFLHAKIEPSSVDHIMVDNVFRISEICTACLVLTGAVFVLFNFYMAAGGTAQTFLFESVDITIANRDIGVGVNLSTFLPSGSVTISQNESLEIVTNGMVLVREYSCMIMFTSPVS